MATRLQNVLQLPELPAEAGQAMTALWQLAVAHAERLLQARLAEDRAALSANEERLQEERAHWAAKRAQNRNVEMVTGGAKSSASAASSGAALSSVDDKLRRDDYAKWMTPRVPGIPWTAPAYDHLEVRSVPRLACMALETGDCSCVTEQGTHYDVPLPTCRSIARNGLYNPFVGEPDQGHGRQAAPGRPDQPQAPDDPGQPAAVSVAGGPRRERATAVPYTPPDYVSRNADEVLK